MKSLIFFVLALFAICACGNSAFAQGADGSAAGEPATSTATTSSLAQEVTPISGGGASARPTTTVATSSAVAQPIPEITVSPDPSFAPAASSADALLPAPSPAPKTPRSLGGGGVGVPAGAAMNDAASAAETGATNMLPIVAAVMVMIGLGVVLALRTKKQSTQKEDPCGALKKEYETAQAAYDLAVKNITLQELLVAELKKEIGMAEEILKEKVKEYAADVTHEIMEDAVKKETSEELSKAVTLADEAKAVYDDFVNKHKLANDLLLTLKARQQGLTDEVRAKETAWGACEQAAALAAGGTASGKVVPTPDAGSSVVRGVIVENSLRDKSVLEKLTITQTRQEGDWVLHDVETTEAQALLVQDVINDGPWYVHFWKEGGEDIIVVFKDKVFRITRGDQETWKEAVAHGRSLGIPDAQLDFAVTPKAA